LRSGGPGAAIRPDGEDAEAGEEFPGRKGRFLSVIHAEFRALLDNIAKPGCGGRPASEQGDQARVLD
jgi:hypothetical protein